MRTLTSRAAVGLVAAGLIVAATAPAAAQEADWPNSGPLNDGSTFTLAPRIADKLANGEPINYVFSYQSPTHPVVLRPVSVGLRDDPSPGTGGSCPA